MLIAIPVMMGGVNIDSDASNFLLWGLSNFGMILIGVSFVLAALFAIPVSLLCWLCKSGRKAFFIASLIIWGIASFLLSGFIFLMLLVAAS
ncbi:MAG: hypothetical protein PHV74_00160 [Dehalococcoidia bacterium]|nr:hypothetical protein [Dehalococcoidia bacterium]